MNSNPYTSRTAETHRERLEEEVLSAYNSETMSAGEAAEMLGLSAMETERFFKERGAYLHLTLEDVEADRKVYGRRQVL